MDVQHIARSRSCADTDACSPCISHHGSRAAPCHLPNPVPPSFTPTLAHSQIRMMDGDSTCDLEGGVYKGPHGDTPQAYIVSAPFELVEADKVGGGGQASSGNCRL